MTLSSSAFFLKSPFKSDFGRSLMKGLFGASGIKQSLSLVPADAPRKMLKPRSASHRIRSVVLHSRDETRLRGWLMTPRCPEVKGAVLYFGNGSEEALWLASQAPGMFPEMTVLVMNYRTAAEGEKQPAVEALVADGEMLYDWLADSHRLRDSFPIVVMGRDCGAGIAVKVAASRPTAALALLTPCDVMPQERRRLNMLRNRNASRKGAANEHAFAFHQVTPTLVLRAQTESAVALERTNAFVARLPAKIQERTISGADYHDLPYRPELQNAVAGFLREHLTPAAAETAPAPAPVAAPDAEDREESSSLAMVA